MYLCPWKIFDWNHRLLHYLPYPVTVHTAIPSWHVSLHQQPFRLRHNRSYASTSAVQGEFSYSVAVFQRKRPGYWLVNDISQRCYILPDWKIHRAMQSISIWASSDYDLLSQERQQRTSALQLYRQVWTLVGLRWGTCLAHFNQWRFLNVKSMAFLPLRILSCWDPFIVFDLVVNSMNCVFVYQRGQDAFGIDFLAKWYHILGQYPRLGLEIAIAYRHTRFVVYKRRFPGIKHAFLEMTGERRLNLNYMFKSIFEAFALQPCQYNTLSEMPSLLQSPASIVAS